MQVVHLQKRTFCDANERKTKILCSNQGDLPKVYISVDEIHPSAACIPNELTRVHISFSPPAESNAYSILELFVLEDSCD